MAEVCKERVRQAMILTEKECRVVGCLIEKEFTTPDYYPLSLNSLTTACNQKSNRAPVVSYDELSVQATLDELCKKGLVARIPNVTNRTIKYRHHFSSHYELTASEVALLCELMLRGNQTPGELRTRAERMHAFASLEEVLEALHKLASREVPLVTILPRQAGMKEHRYAHLLSGDPVTQTVPPALPSVQERMEALEGEVATLRDALEKLTHLFQEFKAQF